MTFGQAHANQVYQLMHSVCLLDFCLWDNRQWAWPFVMLFGHPILFKRRSHIWATLSHPYTLMLVISSGQKKPSLETGAK